MRHKHSQSESTKDSGSRVSGPLGMPSHLPKPYSVHLSRQGMLLFRWPRARSAGQTRKNPPLRRVLPGLWSEFVQLAGRDDGEIRRFAEYWGPLRPSRRPSPATESVEEWRQSAILARALVRTDAAIRRNEPGSAEDWQAICQWLRWAYDPELASQRTKWPGAVVLHRRATVIAALNRWYSASPGNTILVLEGDRVAIRPQVATLFGTIGAQLAYQVISSHKTLICYHCNDFFTPRRIPSTGGRQFCPECRKRGNPQLYAMRDYRRRAKATQ
jgi:hypothetical protein